MTLPILLKYCALIQRFLRVIFAAISTRMIDRIFSGTVTHGTAQKEGKMSYTEFVWFLLAEEDKRHPTSIEYW